MAKNTNLHVERLHRYLPFNPAHDQIYEEYQRSEDSLNLSTRALEYLKHAVASDAGFIVLTGDAGHGKTHLCRRLIEEHLGYDEDGARDLINRSCNGSEMIRTAAGMPEARPLRIFKDISEFPIPGAIAAIEQISEEEGCTTVICANEGRLRAVLESEEAGPICRHLLEAVKAAFADGLACGTGPNHVINLNYQSVASEDIDGLAKLAIHEWTSGTKWRSCNTCDSNKQCPILHNRNLLSPNESERAEHRREVLSDLYATAERLGAVITIREMLMASAYLLTGGLRCQDVHARANRQGWQHPYAFYNLLFSAPPRTQADHLARIPVLAELARIDPGHKASREVDEVLINKQDVFEDGQVDLRFDRKIENKARSINAANGIDEVVGNPRNAKERRAESDFVSEIVRSLRRRAYFDLELSVPTTVRLGFRNGREFLEILHGDVKPPRMAALKNRVIAGLHTIQGLQLGQQETTLHLVDPAFGNATSHAAIIARRLPGAAIQLLSRSRAWDEDGDDKNRRMNSAVDWIDRHVVLRIKNGNEQHEDLALDLMLFDCISRAANGYVASEFYGHEIRRVGNFLARLAEAGDGRDETIALSIRGRLRSISMDEGVIQVGGDS